MNDDTLSVCLFCYKVESQFTKGGAGEVQLAVGEVAKFHFLFPEEAMLSIFPLGSTVGSHRYEVGQFTEDLTFARLHP